MAAITEQDESRAAERRSRLRQDKSVPFLINEDDARLYPNTALMRKRQGYRLYHGPAQASLEDRKRYLLGLSARRGVTYDPEPEAPFDIGTADLEALMTFAQDQFGIVLDSSKPLSKLRKQVFDLSQLPEHELIEAVAAAGRPDPRMEPADDDADPVPRETPAAGDPAAIASAVAKAQATAPAGRMGLGGSAVLQDRTQAPGAAVTPKAPNRGGRQPRNAGVPA
jgi:hypothetical protein